MFGLLAKLGVHEFWVFAAIWAINGFVQASGWPGNVAVMGKWFGSIRLCGVRIARGAVMGLWSGNASTGNILGEQIVNFVLGSAMLSGYYVLQNGDWQGT